MSGDENIRTTAKPTSDGGVVIHETHDVTGIIKANHFLQGEQDLHHKSEVMNHVANIDVLAIKTWCEQRGLGSDWWSEFFKDDKLLKAFLNDPDNRAWRTRLGKI